jgi:hypothetical protein
MAISDQSYPKNCINMQFPEFRVVGCRLVDGWQKIVNTGEKRESDSRRWGWLEWNDYCNRHQARQQ